MLITLHCVRASLVSGLFILISSLLVACDSVEQAPIPPRPALIIEARDNTEMSMGLVGEVRPRYESAQGFRIDGKIMERLVDIGATVTKGQLLARLDKIDSGLAAQASQANVRAANADYQLAKVELDRQRELYQRKTTARSALDSAEAQFNSAKARWQQANAQASASGNQTRYTALMAELDGVVTDIRAEPGQVVSAGQVIAHIADTKALEVAIAVPESRMQGVVPGVNVIIRLWAVPNQIYQGTVREVSPTADSLTRTFQARVSITDPDINVRMGMTAGVLFKMEQAKALIMLPISAVSQYNGQTVAWVLDTENKVQPKAVETYQFREDGVLISSGLEEGEKVVAVGVQALTPGQSVRPILKDKR
ncbi:MAG: efflux RND transporter periplasmic adaptor subunit [Methylococcaceae bacterium]|jgi:RND family efflux transporter MFP subunit